MVGIASFRTFLISGTAFAVLAAVPAAAQEQGGVPGTQEVAEADDRSGGDILVTGSRIRQDPNNSALPLQIITTQEIQRNGISSTEQLMQYLSELLARLYPPDPFSGS